MSCLAAPGWARLTGQELGGRGGPSRGSRTAQKRKISFAEEGAKGFAALARTFGKPAYGGCAMSCQINWRSSGEPHVPRLALALRPRPRSGGARSQHRPARAGFVKYLPLFFDLAGRRVVVVGAGAAAERRAELARSAGAAVYRVEAVSVADLKGAAAVFVATDDLEADIDAQRAAKAAGVPVNVADRPQLSDFILPAIVDR